MPYTDFGARLYSPVLRRWMAPDKLSEKHYDINPYVYCAGNPVNLVDPDGKRFYKKIVGNTIIISATVIPFYRTLNYQHVMPAQRIIQVVSFK